MLVNSCQKGTFKHRCVETMHLGKLFQILFVVAVSLL